MQPNSPFDMFFILGLIFIVWYFLVIRPEQKKQKERVAMIGALKKNDTIITAGGIHGTIVNVKEKTFVLRVDDNAKIEVEKTSVSFPKKDKSA